MGFGAEHAGTAGRVAVLRQPRDRGTALRQRLVRVPADPQVAPEALADQRGGHGVGLRIDERQRPAGERGGPGVLAGELRGVRGAADEVDQARPLSAHVLGHSVPQLDGTLVVGVGLGEGGEPPGLCAGLRRGGERRGKVVRREPMERELGGHAAGGDRERRIGLQRAGQRGVQRPALAREQVVGQRLAHERVAEAVGVGLGVRHDDVVRHRLAQPGHQVVGREAARALEQPVTHARARDGSQAQDGLGGRSQRLDAQHERIGDVGGQALAGGGGGQLLGEERVALGAGEQLVDEARLGPAPEDPRQLRDDLLAREALQSDALDDRGALGFGQQRSEGMAAVQLVGAVRGDQQHALVARVAHEEGQEVARGAVGPVDVLEDEHQGLRLGQASQEGEQELEHATLRERALGAGLGRVELGQQRRQARGGAAELAGVEAAQRADDRRVGQLAVAEVDAVAGQHARRPAPARGRRARRPGASCRRPTRPRPGRPPGARRPRGRAPRKGRRARARARRTRGS